MRLPTFYEQNLIPNWGDTSFMGTKKDKRYACLLYCISTTLLTSSSCHPKIFVKEFSYFLMPCHQHGLGVNLLVQR